MEGYVTHRRRHFLKTLTSIFVRDSGFAHLNFLTVPVAGEIMG